MAADRRCGRRPTGTVSTEIRSEPTAALAADPLPVRANKLDLLERLADSLAHEIKNPLHSMVINLEVLRRRLSRAQVDADALRYAAVLAEELDRVNRRIELLLRLARPDRGAEDTTLREVVEELMELIQLEARHREVRVEYQTEGHVARVRVPRQPMRQIVLNLVLDSLDSVPAGQTLHLRTDGEADLCRLTVRGGSSSDPSGERLAVAALLAETVGGRVEAGSGALVFTLPESGV